MAQTDLTFCIDFESEVVGQAPGTSSGPAPNPQISFLRFGDPTVVANAGPLATQALQFGNGTGGFDQVGIQVDDYRFGDRFPFLSYDRFQLEMDLVLTDVSSRFSIFFDGLTSVLTFEPNGEIREGFNPQTLVGNYQFGESLRIRVDIDLHTSSETLQLTVNGTSSAPVGVPSGGQQGTPVLRSIRWSLDGHQATSDPAALTESVALDNIKLLSSAASPAVDLGFRSLGGPSLHADSTSVVFVDVHLAEPLAPIALIFSPQSLPIPLFGGTLVPGLGSAISVGGTADALGRLSIELPILAPLDTVFAQVASFDGSGTAIVFSNAVQFGL
ncbi:MAG: hypothetical protein AAF196_09940 [Planctomycetota bacterium]